jgi:hypothetical protein
VLLLVMCIVTGLVGIIFCASKLFGNDLIVNVSVGLRSRSEQILVG